MKPGVYNITNEEYHGGPGISRSGIMTFKKAPIHYHHQYILGNRPESDSSALIFGNALHTYILEPHLFAERFHVWERVNGRKPASNTKAWDEIVIAANGKSLLGDDEFNDIKAIGETLKAHELASGVITGGTFERSLYWEDKDTGLLCKVRPDIWHTNMIADLKTTRCASMRDFQNSIYQYGYHIQAGMIHEALFNLYGINMMNFIFIAVEKEAPFATAVYTLSEQAVLKGVEEFKKTLFQIKDCMTTNNWPSYDDAIVDLPAYAYINTGDL